MFRNRQEAGELLGQELSKREWRNPLVLAIPRGGVVTGAAIAQILHAELDVMLSRKLRAPDHPEFALGALSEDGSVYMNPQAEELKLPAGYLEQEKHEQFTELTLRKQLFREVKQQASITGRSDILTDDGLATGSTMLAAISVVRLSQPYELIVAVPVAPPSMIEKLRSVADNVVCLEQPEYFWAVGQHYEDFEQTTDEEVLELLRRAVL